MAKRKKNRTTLAQNIDIIVALLQEVDKKEEKWKIATPVISFRKKNDKIHRDLWFVLIHI